MTCEINHIHSADIRERVVKIKKKNVWCILTLMLGSLFLAIDRRYNFCDKFSSVILSVSLHFLNYRTNRLHGFDEEMYFPDNCSYENG